MALYPSQGTSLLEPSLVVTDSIHIENHEKSIAEGLSLVLSSQKCRSLTAELYSFSQHRILK